MFRSFLESFGILEEEDFALLENKTYQRTIPKHEFFIQEGAVAREVGFVHSGLLRSFYYSSDGEEVTYCFILPNSSVSAFTSFITQNPSQESIQALSNVQMTCLSGEDLLELEEKSKNWLNLSKIIAQQEYMNLEKRVFMLQKESAEQRYKDLLLNQPELLQLISLQQLASYLGISQRHLSRIRGFITI